jgi:DNA-directed RNA polymerase subunit E'/Rpb7
MKIRSDNISKSNQKKFAFHFHYYGVNESKLKLDLTESVRARIFYYDFVDSHFDVTEKRIQRKHQSKHAGHLTFLNNSHHVHAHIMC